MGSGPPAPVDAVFHPHGIQYLAGNKIYHIIQILWRVVETYNRRRYLYAHAGKLEHILKVDRTEGHLPRRDNQSPALFYYHISGTFNEIVRITIRNTGKGLH